MTSIRNRRLWNLVGAKSLVNKALGNFYRRPSLSKFPTRLWGLLEKRSKIWRCGRSRKLVDEESFGKVVENWSSYRCKRSQKSISVLRLRFWPRFLSFLSGLTYIPLVGSDCWLFTFCLLTLSLFKFFPPFYSFFLKILCWPGTLRRPESSRTGNSVA